MIQFGQASLLVYWVHIEFVYGRVSILHKRAQGIGMASVGLVVIFFAMLALAYVRTHWKGWKIGSSVSSVTPAQLLSFNHGTPGLTEFILRIGE